LTEYREAALGVLTQEERRLNAAWWALRVGLGVGMVLTGIDKFFNLLAMWSMYMSPLAEKLLPFSDTVFLRVVGVGEALIGLAILTRWTRAGSYLLGLWLLAIVANLATSGNFWDLAMRDAELALASYALARLTEWRVAVTAREAVPAARELQLERAHTHV
jgi:uncharacterized membrane protein YphA (DoxX/SURF4 family)